MKRRLIFAFVIAALSVTMAAPAHLHGQQATDPADHAEHHPGSPATQAAPPTPGGMGSMTSAAKLEALVARMNAAKGDAKVAAMAELLTALANDRQACEPMMASMMKMMESMGGAQGTMPMQPPAK